MTAFDPAAFLAYLVTRGITAEARGGRIMVANASRLTDDDRAAIAANRPAILQHLEDAATACPGVCPGIATDGCRGCPVPMATVPASVREIDPDGWPCGWECKEK